MKKLPLTACLLFSAFALLLTGCSTVRLPTSYGPNYYDMEGANVAVVSISDTNYPSLFNSPRR